METDDIDGSSSHATEKDDAEEAAVPAVSDEPAEKDDVSIHNFSFMILKFSH